MWYNKPILICEVIDMAIVKHTTPSGITYCYDSTPKWDPEKKQARPQKKYLGRWDEETQTIIPTTGKRGRKKKGGGDAGILENGGSEEQLPGWHEKILVLQEKLAAAENEIARLKKENQKYEAAIAAIRREVQRI